jgi:hypothetical protein
MGEDPKKTTPDQLFGIVSQFIDLFKAAAVELQKNRIESEKKQKREEAKQKRVRTTLVMILLRD